jgi:hypothetical protein
VKFYVQEIKEERMNNSQKQVIRDVFREARGDVSCILRRAGSGEVITDPVELAGIFNKSVDRLTVYADGTVHLDSNLIVNGARGDMSRLLVADGNGSGARYVTKMSFGDGGHDPMNPTVAIPPTVLDVALGHEHVSIGKKTVTYDFPSATSVRLIAGLSDSEGNGLGLSEVGLWTTDNPASPGNPILFARKTFGLITKSSLFSITFYWEIIF